MNKASAKLDLRPDGKINVGAATDLQRLLRHDDVRTGEATVVSQEYLSSHKAEWSSGVSLDGAGDEEARQCRRLRRNKLQLIS